VSPLKSRIREPVFQPHNFFLFSGFEEVKSVIPYFFHFSFFATVIINSVPSSLATSISIILVGTAFILKMMKDKKFLKYQTKRGDDAYQARFETD